MRPQNIKNFHFFVGRLPWPISKIFRGFYAPVYPTWVFKIWRDSLHRLLSYCWETARRSIRPIFFRAPCRKNYALHRKMDDYFLMATVSSITTQSLGKIALRAPAVDAETWYLYVFFCNSVALRGRRAVRSRVTIWTGVMSRFIIRFWCCLHRFFQHWLPFQVHYALLISVASWRHKFRTIAFKNFEKSKNRRKSLWAPLRIDSWGICRR